MSKFLPALLISLAAVCRGQPPSLNPPPIRATLNEIVATVSRYPRSADTGELLDGIRKSVIWLGGRLSDNRIPVVYARDLEQDAAVLEVTLTAAPDLQARALRDVFADVRLKHADCRRFGMGRLVKLEVRTVKDGREVSGWQIFSRWLPARAVGEVRPQPFLSLSSPASTEIPPGAYSVQAKKTIGGSEVASAELPVAVGGQKTVTIEIPVP